METPLETLLWEARRLFRTAARAADEVLEPLGINAGDRALLEFLAREREPVSLSELARKRSVSRQHIHQALARLPQPDWITRQPDPADARSVRLTLSPSGRAFWKKLRGADRALLRRIQGDVDSAKLLEAAATLRSVRAVLENKIPKR